MTAATAARAFFDASPYQIRASVDAAAHDTNSMSRRARLRPSHAALTNAPAQERVRVTSPTDQDCVPVKGPPSAAIVPMYLPS